MNRLLPAAAALLLWTTAALAADADPVVAQQGTYELTASQARALLAGADPETQHKLATDPAAMKDFLRSVLLQHAILDVAKTQKWDQRPEVAALLQRAHDQVLAQSFLNAQAPLPAGYPTKADVQAAYDQNKARLTQPRSYHLAQIYLPASAIHGDDGRKRLADLRLKLQRSRGSFEEAAKALPASKYVDLGLVPETNLVPSVKPAIAGLPEGGTSEPICTQGGCTILHVIAIRPAGPALIGDVHEQLVRALRQQKTQQEAQAYAGSLLAKQPVQLNEIQLSHLTSTAPATP